MSDKRFRITLTMGVQETTPGSPPGEFHDVVHTWHNMPYTSLLDIQQGLMDFIARLHAVGVDNVVQAGHGDMLRIAKPVGEKK